MDHAFRFTAEKIARRIALVKAHRYRAMRPLAPFRFRRDCGPMAALDSAPNDCWQELEPGAYWAGADTHFTLKTRFALPSDYKHPALHLPLGTLGDIFNHPEALITVDGQIMGSADRHHHTICLSNVAPGEHELALQGWTGLAGWPPSADAPDRLMMRACHLVELNPDLEDVLTLAACALEAVELLDDRGTRNKILDALDAAFLELDTRHPLGASLHDTAHEARETLRSGLAAAGPTMDADITAIGHAHMDIAYLWPVAESRAKNARTYSNVLQLMDRHDDFRFTHSQPQLYDYTKRDFPEIFARIKTRVAEGRWELTGGMWVEADTNLPGAEALARQILLGRRWFREEFGDVETPILWLPDTFGFAWCLPQLMTLSGLDLLITNKLNWNQHTRHPTLSWWEGMDGSKVLFQLLTTPRDVQHLPFPTNYKSDMSGAEVKGTATNTLGASPDNLPILFGFGDGGGGPTEDLIARAKTFANMPTMPRTKMGRASDILTATKSTENLTIWSDELYMEGHRGVLTSQAWIKRANRQAEAALHRAELVAVLTGTTQQTKPLGEAWKLLCLNQFHDTLAGTAVGQVFEDARGDYARIAEICAETESAAPSNGPLAVLNPSPLPRHDLVLVQTAPAGLPCQKTEDGSLVGLPPLEAYQAKLLTVTNAPAPLSIRETAQGVTLENAFLIAEIGADGTLARVTDKTANRDLLAEGERGNQLWAFEDRPLSWDAWDIDPFFEDRAEEITDVATLKTTETGPLRVALRVTRIYRNSTITQDIRLTDRSPRLDFATKIDWQERHTLLKASFPLAIIAPTATYGIQWGHIARPTTRDTVQDASRFEVCGHKWAALHDGEYATAILNDCKYGHDTLNNVMRLTLIKSSTMPDPDADQGHHEFNYALFPQTGAGYEAIRAEAEALNHPVLIGPGLAKFPQIARTDASNVIIETVKPSEDGAGYVLRLYEAEGRNTSATLTLVATPRSVTEVNLMEDARAKREHAGPAVPLTLKPFQILTLLIEP